MHPRARAARIMLSADRGRCHRRMGRKQHHQADEPVPVDQRDGQGREVHDPRVGHGWAHPGRADQLRPSAAQRPAHPGGARPHHCRGRQAAQRQLGQDAEFATRPGWGRYHPEWSDRHRDRQPAAGDLRHRRHRWPPARARRRTARRGCQAAGRAGCPRTPPASPACRRATTATPGGSPA